MPRLPTPGNSDNNWGALLNEFLQVSYNEVISFQNVSDADTVTVRFNNYSSQTVSPPPGSFRVAIIKF